MIIDNAQANTVDMFMDFMLREGGPGPNFYLPVGELYLELPARRCELERRSLWLLLPPVWRLWLLLLPVSCA
jgi:hypothetical protein